MLNLEGLWTRYEDPEPLLAEIAELPDDEATAPHAGDLRRADQARADRRAHQGDPRPPASCRARRSRRSGSQAFAEQLLDAELDLLVIQGTVVSAEHVTEASPSRSTSRRFVRRLDMPVIVGGCSSYQAALHLMRTGAAGMLVGVGAGQASTTRRVLGIGVAQATAIADARGARMRHLDETGVYVHVIADGGMATGGDIAKAIVCGADAVMIGAPLAAAVRGARPRLALGPGHRSTPTCPAAVGCPLRPSARSSEILLGPAHDDDGRTNLMGALRRAMALVRLRHPQGAPEGRAHGRLRRCRRAGRTGSGRGVGIRR